MNAGAWSVIVVAQTFTCFFTSTSSFGISPSDGGCTGHSFSDCHKNFGPLSHRCCSVNVLASSPREASSEGFSFASTYLHWLGMLWKEESKRIRKLTEKGLEENVPRLKQKRTNALSAVTRKPGGGVLCIFLGGGVPLGL